MPKVLCTWLMLCVLAFPALAGAVSITQLGELTEPAGDDVIPVVDISDTTEATTGTTKKITVGNFVVGMDADLTLLASPTAWRLFYSNGSQAITELALGASGLYLMSNGAASAPSWEAGGGGGGSGDMLKTVYDTDDDGDVELAQALVSDLDIDQLAGDTVDDDMLDFNAIGVQDWVALVDADATPDVSTGHLFKTANTGGTTITDFDWGGAAVTEGAWFHLLVNDAFTTIQFSNGSIYGHGENDFTPTAAGNGATCLYDGTDWHCSVWHPTVIKAADFYVPGAADCSTETGDGQLCHETDTDILWKGDGAAVKAFYPADTLTDEYLCSYESTGTKIVCDVGTSAGLAAALSDESGTDKVAFTTSPVFTTPNIGAATGSVTGNAGTATALAANGANCDAGNAPLGVNASGASESCTDFEEDLSNSAGLLAALSDETGTGYSVFNTLPDLLGVNLKNGAASAGYVSIFEDSDDGGNYTKIQVVAQAGDITYSLPPDDGDAAEVLTTSGAGVLTWEAAGAGDVTGVGDCASGACLDGTNDGGSYIKIYDGDSNYGEIQVPDIAGDVTYTLPATSVTLENDDHASEHAVGAADTLFPADPNADKCLEWDDDPGALAWVDCGAGGATALDDIGDPDAATSIAMGDNESLTLASLEDTGSVLIIEDTDADLAGDTSFIDLKFTDDGDANGFFMRGYDNAGGDLKWSIGPDGLFTGSFSGALTGNASTASALFADPADCDANKFAQSIATSGALTCAAIADADVPDGITITLAGTATALAADPADCVDGQAALGIAASGAANCVSLGASALAAEDFGGFTCSGAAAGCAIDQNAGTDVTADLEEETHALEHAVAAADTIFPADPNADKFLQWDDDPGALVWADAGGSTALDDVGDPDASTTIALGNNETVFFDSAEDTGTIFTIGDSDAALADVTTILDLDFNAGSFDGTANAVFLRMQDYVSDVYVFTDAQFSSYRPIVSYEGNAVNGGITNFTVSQTLEAMNEATDYVKGYLVDWTNANHGAGNIYGFEADLNAADAETTETAFKVTGAWDTAFDANALAMTNVDEINSGNRAMTIGDATTDSITFDTDATGNGEFTFPEDVIGEADIDWGAGAGQVSCVDIGTTDCGAITSSGTVAGVAGTFSGTLTGLVGVTVDTDATIDLATSANCSGQMRVNGDADAIDYTLPPAVAGLNCCFYGQATGIITIDPDDANDTIFLNGVTVGAGDAIDSPGFVGNFVCLLALDATNWVTLGISGAWADGGAD